MEKIKKVGILYHPMIEAAHDLAQRLNEFLAARGLSVWLNSAWEAEKARVLIDDTELVLSVGGDGTILRSAQAITPRSIPIVGINLGHLGFLTELSTEEITKELPRIVAGEGWVDERAMLEAELVPAGGTPKPQTFHALNDVVMARGAVVRIISVEASVDNEPLYTYRADGVIMATATGSTGYALAAGGPIIHPSARELLLVPILTHLTSPHSMVLSPDSIVKLRLNTTHQATMSIDGHINLPIGDGATVTVKQSPATTRFLRIHPQSTFYRTLDQKLKGKR